MKVMTCPVKPVFLLVTMVLALLQVSAASAEIGCQDCHGTRSPSDYRPIDSPNRNIFTGGFQGNHRTHVAGALSAPSCEKCHPGSSAYGTGHRDGKIKLSANINNSPLQALYKNSTSAFLQTPEPLLGTCTNVNCHFEQISPVWGSATFVYPNDCLGTCHGSPPAGGAGGAAGSHDTHDFYFSGLANCAFCHANHVVEPAPFAHASSAANRGVLVGSTSPYFGNYGLYTGNTGDFLPSQTNQFGSCTTVYCHSSVQGLSNPTQSPVTLYAPTWGETFSDSICAGTKGCHGVGFAHPDDALIPADQERFRTLLSGSHERHLKYRFNEVGNCEACHYNFTGNGNGCSGCHMIHGPFQNHIDQTINVTFDPGNSLFNEGTGVYTGDTTAGTPYGTCSGLYCHGNGTTVSTGVLNNYSAIAWGSGALTCSSCHGYPPAYTNGTPKANSHLPHDGYSCDKCHYSVTTNGSTIATSRYHVNRTYDVAAGTGISFTYSYAASGGSCTNISCHHGGNAVWGGTLACDGCHDAPPATASHTIHYGGSIAQAGYGDVRIAADYGSTASSYIMNCGNCHPMDASHHGNGTIEVELYNATAPAGSLKALNPATAVYVNGTTSHLDSRGFAYSYGTCSNVYCHSYTDWTTPGGVQAPYTSSTSLPANLVVSTVYRTIAWGGPSLGCTGCHANPPSTTYLTNAGGSGNSHSWIDSYGYENLHNYNHSWQPISCSYCHNGTVTQLNSWTRNSYDVSTMSDVPIANHAKHVNGQRDLLFDPARLFNYSTSSYGVVSMDLSTASYSQATKTCSNVACHMPRNSNCGGQQNVQWGMPYRWDSGECYRCHQYNTTCP